MYAVVEPILILSPMMRLTRVSTLFPYTTLFRSWIFRQLRIDATDLFKKVFPIERGKQPHARDDVTDRSEEHTSELQSRFDIVCRLLLEKKNVTPSSR